MAKTKGKSKETPMTVEGILKTEGLITKKQQSVLIDALPTVPGIHVKHYIARALHRRSPVGATFKDKEEEHAVFWELRRHLPARGKIKNVDPKYRWYVGHLIEFLGDTYQFCVGAQMRRWRPWASDHRIDDITLRSWLNDVLFRCIINFSPTRDARFTTHYYDSCFRRRRDLTGRTAQQYFEKSMRPTVWAEDELEYIRVTRELPEHALMLAEAMAPGEEKRKREEQGFLRLLNSASIEPRWRLAYKLNHQVGASRRYSFEDLRRPFGVSRGCVNIYEKKAKKLLKNPKSLLPPGISGNPDVFLFEEFGLVPPTKRGMPEEEFERLPFIVLTAVPETELRGIVSELGVAGENVSVLAEVIGEYGRAGTERGSNWSRIQQEFRKRTESS